MELTLFESNPHFETHEREDCTPLNEDEAAEAIRDRSQGRIAARAAVQRGLTHHLNGEYEPALRHFTTALRADPTSARAHSLRGDVYRALGEYDSALADFTAAIRLDPDDASHYIRRGQVYRLTGNLNGAVADCGHALTLDPGSGSALASRADAFADMADQDRAIADYTAAINLNPNVLAAHFSRGKAHARRGEPDRALADFTRVLELNPDYAPAYLQRGHAYRDRGEFRRAISDYTESLGRLRHPIAFTSRGRAYEQIGEASQAIADFTEALRLDPTDATVFCSRGVLHYQNSDFALSLADLDQAIHLHPENAKAYFHRGMIGLSVDQLPPAIRQFDEAIRLSPDYVTAYLNRALAHDRSGSPREAIRDCSAAIERSPGLAPAYLIRGIAWSNVKDFGKSIADLSRAIDLDPGFALAYRRRARAYTHGGSFAEALADYDRLVALEPNDALAYANRGVVHRLLGDHTKAVADLDRALRLDPKSILAGWDRNLGELDRRQSAPLLANYAAGGPPIRIEARIPTVSDLVVPNEPPVETAPVAPVLPPPLAHVSLQDAKPQEPAVRTRNPAASAHAVPANVAAAKTEPDLVVVETTALDILLEEDTRPAPPRLVPAESPELAGSGSALAVVRCILCKAVGTPSETLAGNRVRCGKCNVVFVPAPTGTAPARAVTAVAKRPTHGTDVHITVDDDGRRIPKKLALQICAAMVAGVGLVLGGGYLFGLNGSTATVPVYPAHGKITYHGQPVPNASLVLHPVGKVSASVPTPRATAKEDGTFEFGTFRPGDGAPSGEYKVTVVQLQPAAAMQDEGELKSLLPKRYAAVKSSGLTVRITAGDNALPTIDLKN